MPLQKAIVPFRKIPFFMKIYRVFFFSEEKENEMEDFMEPCIQKIMFLRLISMLRWFGGLHYWLQVEEVECLSENKLAWQEGKYECKQQQYSKYRKHFKCKPNISRLLNKDVLNFCPFCFTPHSYLIFVIFFTLAKFLENKIYTEKRVKSVKKNATFSRKICRKCQFFA